MFGHFSCIVEADSPDETEEKFQKLLKRYKNENKVFTILKSAKIYQDSLVEISSVPMDGAMLAISEFLGEEPAGCIDGVTPGNEEGLAGLRREVEQEPGTEIEPFMEFGD